MPRIFSTAGLPDMRRIELWESHNAAALIGLSCHTAASDSLEATEPWRDSMLLFELTDQIRDTVQQTLYRNLVKRHSVFH